MRQYQRGLLSDNIIPYRVPAGSSIEAPTSLPGADQVRTYGLDGLGNWKTTNFTQVGSGGSTTSTAESRQHNYLNEITSVKDTIGGGSPATTPYAYDKNGNLLNDGVRSYHWDALNRLVQIKRVSDNATIGSYAYDAFNRRIQKTIANGGLSGDVTNGTTNYLYDAQQIVQARDNTGAWKQTYFWGQYIDELLFFAVSTITVPTTYRVLSDLLYRSTAIVTTSNVITEAYDCDAYGNTLCYFGPGTDGQWFTNDDVTTHNPINTTIFTGRQFDPESQIYYYRARYFASALGRFISRDPLQNAELRQGPNTYEYVLDNAANLLDPTGLQVPLEFFLRPTTIPLPRPEIVNKGTTMDPLYPPVTVVPNPNPEPSNSPDNRGRIQAQGCGPQGGRTERSVSWSQKSPPTDQDGYSMVNALKFKLSPGQLADRANAFAKVVTWIGVVASAKGVYAPVSKSFDGSGKARVDVEVITGKAFVPKAAPSNPTPPRPATGTRSGYNYYPPDMV